jgi:hypothetical protein
MNRDDRLRSFGDRRLYLRNVHVEGVRIDIHEDRNSADVGCCLSRE